MSWINNIGILQACIGQVVDKYRTLKSKYSET